MCWRWMRTSSDRTCSPQHSRSSGSSMAMRMRSAWSALRACSLADLASRACRTSDRHSEKRQHGEQRGSCTVRRADLPQVLPIPSFSPEAGKKEREGNEEEQRNQDGQQKDRCSCRMSGSLETTHCPERLHRGIGVVRSGSGGDRRGWWRKRRNLSFEEADQVLCFAKEVFGVPPTACDDVGRRDAT